MKSHLAFTVLALIVVPHPQGPTRIQPPERPLITAITQIAFYCRDIRASTRFYEDYLQLSHAKTDKFRKKPTAGSVLDINPHQSVRLIPEHKTRESRLAYFAIETNNAKAMHIYLASKGVKVPDALNRNEIGELSFSITDPDGTECIIVEPAFKKSTEKRSATKDTKLIGHVGFMVKNLDRTIQFYCNLLGFKESWRGSKDGIDLSWVNLKIPDGNGYVELMLYDRPQSTENMGILNHFAMEVADVYKVSKELSARKLPEHCKVTTEVKIGINKKRQLNSFDPDSTRIEIMERKAFDGIPAKSSTAKEKKLK